MPEAVLPDIVLLEAALLLSFGDVASIFNWGSLLVFASLAEVVFSVPVVEVSWVSVLLQAIKVETTIAKVTIFFIVMILNLVLSNVVKIVNTESILAIVFNYKYR